MINDVPESIGNVNECIFRRLMSIQLDNTHIHTKKRAF